MPTPDRIKAVEAIAPKTLEIQLASGKSYHVSLAEPINRIAGFNTLSEPGMFATVRVVDDG